jgi:hypothetical protein
LGRTYGAVAIQNVGNGYKFVRVKGVIGQNEELYEITNVDKYCPLYFKLTVNPSMNCQFYYSTDGESYTTLLDSFEASAGA